jgi:hypothetical protein
LNIPFGNGRGQYPGREVVAFIDGDNPVQPRLALMPISGNLVSKRHTTLRWSEMIPSLGNRGY